LQATRRLHGSFDIARLRVKRLWIFVLGSTYCGLLFYAAPTAPPQQFSTHLSCLAAIASSK
jgi:hypothetical protein